METVTLREHLEGQLLMLAHRLDQLDGHVDAVAAAQAAYLRRDSFEAAHESLRAAVDTLRATQSADAGELRAAVGVTRSRLAGASAAIIVAVTVVSALMTALTVWGK